MTDDDILKGLKLLGVDREQRYEWLVAWDPAAAEGSG